MATGGSPALLVPMLLDEPGAFSANDKWASCTSASAALDALLAMSDGFLDGLAADSLPSGEADADVPRATSPAPVNDSGYGASGGTASSSLLSAPAEDTDPDDLLLLDGFFASVDGVEDMPDDDGLYDMPPLNQAQCPRASSTLAAALADDPWMGVDADAGRNGSSGATSDSASLQSGERIYVVPPNEVRLRPLPSSKLAAATHGSVGTPASAQPRSCVRGGWADAHAAVHCMRAWVGR